LYIVSIVFDISRFDLETKLQEIDRRKIDQEAYKHAEKEKMEERIRVANEGKETAERERLVLQ
jgi:hypothetical protein